MISLVYLSESNVDFTESDLKKLETLAKNKNKEVNITGFLSYQRNRFVQYIEGRESDLLSLMESIEKDERHFIIHKIQRTNQGDRLFPDWNMRLIRKEELQRFQLELQIEQNLIFIKNDFSHKDRCEKFLWNHVNLISKIKKLRYKNG